MLSDAISSVFRNAEFVNPKNTSIEGNGFQIIFILSTLAFVLKSNHRLSSSELPRSDLSWSRNTFDDRKTVETLITY